MKPVGLVPLRVFGCPPVIDSTWLLARTFWPSVASLAWGSVLLWLLGTKAWADELPAPDATLHPLPVPQMEIVPMPGGQARVTRDGMDVTAYHFGPQYRRPFLFPVNGPSGRSLTRIGHPRDPNGHSHHHSVWIGHEKVDANNFWSDRPDAGRIVHQRITEYSDGDEAATIGSHNRWMIGDKASMEDYRRYRIEPLPNGEMLIVLDIELHAMREPVTLGQSQFGLLGVRMAKSIGVHDGGGRIRNSEGGVNEEQIFWKPARWCDYSGAITPAAIEGITLFDHPANFNHPCPFHVRNDGWMGATLTKEGERTIQPGEPLRLRYGLYVHAGMSKMEVIENRWKAFAANPVPASLLPRKQ